MQKTGRCEVRNARSNSLYLFIVMLTALLSASNERRSHMISAVAPPSFCNKIVMKLENRQIINRTIKIIEKNIIKATISSTTYLAKFVKVLKICFVESVPHNLNIHVIQILQKTNSSHYEGNVSCQEK